MPPSRRAKQFAPFDALKGLKEAIAAKERRPTPRRELTEYAKEQVNKALTELRKGQQVTVIFYGNLEEEELQQEVVIEHTDNILKPSIAIDEYSSTAIEKKTERQIKIDSE